MLSDENRLTCQPLILQASDEYLSHFRSDETRGRAGVELLNHQFRHCVRQDQCELREFRQHNNARAVFRETIQVVVQKLAARLFRKLDVLNRHKANQSLGFAKRFQSPVLETHVVTRRLHSEIRQDQCLLTQFPLIGRIRLELELGQMKIADEVS